MHIYLRASSPGQSGGGAEKEGFAPPPESFLAGYIYISMSHILFRSMHDPTSFLKYRFDVITYVT